MGENTPGRGPVLGMRDAEFRMLADLLRSHCGLRFGPDSRYLLESRLGPRVLDLGLRSFMTYHYVLRHDTGGDTELSWVVDALTNNETYFFREPGQLRALVEEILPELRLERRKTHGTPISIWSAGCSSGEEPYSVAMLALEAGFVPGRDLRIYASDISRLALQKARRGIYGSGSFRATEPSLREKYFVEQDGLHRIVGEIKKHVRFLHMNLLERSRMALFGPMDVILCRNVIIYFDLETKRTVIRNLHETLRPGGTLLLGSAESLINLSSDFELRHLQHDLVYRRPLPGATSARWQAARGEALAAGLTTERRN